MKKYICTLLFFSTITQAQDTINSDLINKQANDQTEESKEIKEEQKMVVLSEGEKLLISVPTYNEKENITSLCQIVRSIAPSADILIIDDNSPDGTGQVADDLAAQDSHIKVMHRPSKLGLGTAHVASYDYAHEHTYTYLITMDADFTHDPKYLVDLVAARDNADIVIGSRYAEGAEIKEWGTFRLLLTRFWRGCLRLGTGMPYDCTGAYRLYRVSALDPEIYTSITSPGYSFGLELLFKLNAAGARVKQVPIVAYGRVKGKSKLSGTEMWQMFKSYMHLLRLRIFGDAKKPNKIEKKIHKNKDSSEEIKVEETN